MSICNLDWLLKAVWNINGLHHFQPLPRAFKESTDSVEETTKIIKLSWLIFWQPTFCIFEKQPGKLGRLHKVKAIRKPLYEQRPIKENKNKKKQENDQKRNRSKEVCFSSSSWKKLVETYKKKRTANRNKTNHEQVYSTYSERFWCQETYWTRTVTNHTNSNFNLVSCTQVLRLCYEIIPFIVSSGNLSNSRKWLVTNSYDFCPPISHSFFVFRFLEDLTLLSNELWLKASILSFITAARLSPPARFRER